MWSLQWKQTHFVGSPNCFDSSPCSPLSSWLAQLCRQLLLDGQQRQPADHMARSFNQVLQCAGSSADHKQVGEEQDCVHFLIILLKPETYVVCVQFYSDGQHHKFMMEEIFDLL